jgi:phage terminase large subunit
MTIVNTELAAKLQPLFFPKRYKVLYGGRGGMKSWGIAKAGLITSVQEPLRWLCAREFQNSIAESVHKVLADQITHMGMNYLWEVQRDRIFTRPGVLPPGEDGTPRQSSFAFEGIHNNVLRIKSYEGVDRCWVEEANKVPRTSWEVLVPTIRKPGSEIWISFNPELATDYTYEFFVTNSAYTTPDRIWIEKLTFEDNPWLSKEMRDELEAMKASDYDAFLNVWMGECRVMLDGAVYAKELRRARSEQRITEVPWDRATPVDVFWDLGRADYTALWFIQRVGMQYRVLRYYENRGEDLVHYIQYCQRRPYLYGTLWLPHDAKAKRLGSKTTIEEIVRGFFPSVRITPRLSVEDGINAARMVFGSCYFDKKGCAQGINRLEHYRYEVKEGVYSDKPLHDSASDGADAFRYFAVVNKRVGMKKEPLALGAAEGVRSSLSLRERLGTFRANTDWMGR